MQRRAPHAEALDRFYASQAFRYDAFRDRLLHGRKDMIEALPVGSGARLVELGGGTARNLDFFGPRLATFASVDVVDLCAPLLQVAARRVGHRPNVRLVTADAAAYRPEMPVDCVYLSYALTMMPQWSEVVDNAASMLRPGGTIGVVDFYVSPAVPPEGRLRHGWLSRTLWPAWFRHDGVQLDADHLGVLMHRFETVSLWERRAPVPYLPAVTVPYYVFIGRKGRERRG
jgi:S-adenosylmethionine-diacylgycerolhomoserine-N-methlytransferase